MSNEIQITGNTEVGLAHWTAAEYEKLVELVKPHSFLYNVQDPSRKNILARESTWEQIADEMSKPVEECKKRWRALRDGYMKTLKSNWSKKKIGVFKQLEFLSEATHVKAEEEEHQTVTSNVEDGSEQVITDTQEYYEITLAENPQDEKSFYSKVLIPQVNLEEPPKKIGKKNCGRKKNLPPPPVNLTPIKILPKPAMRDGGAKLIPLNEAPKIIQSTSQRSEVLDNLIEKVLKEHTNEIDVFFRSMAASVKKLQPNLIPKVKMEVCNVIAKYEMQSFEKNSNGF